MYFRIPVFCCSASCGRCARRTRRLDIGRYCRSDFGLYAYYFISSYALYVGLHVGPKKREPVHFTCVTHFSSPRASRDDDYNRNLTVKV